MADFNFYINRQGIQGRKGEKGDKGFSPTINVSTDTVDEYKLIIANEDNTFETPNLRGNINVLDNGGTYLRYDKETQQISAQDMDAATASTLGGVRLSTEENITAMSADTVVTPADVADALPVYLQGEGAVTITQDEVTSKTKINVDLSSVNELNTRVSNAEAEIVGIQADVADLNTDVSALKDITTSHTTSISAINDNIANLNANKVSKTDFATTETAGIVKADGTTITVNENGVISSINTGTGDVTAAGNNRFTGDNTFIGKVNIAGGALTVDGVANLNQTTVQFLNAVSITSPGEINATSIKANGLRSDDIQTTENKKYLTELDVDNQTIQVVNGKLHANLDELGNEVNNLTGRVTATEADITTLQTDVTDLTGAVENKQNKLVSGDNITLTDNVDGTTTISASGGTTPTNMVTTDTVQTITGQKSFTGSTKFGASGYAGSIDVGDLRDAYFHIYGSRSGANRYLSIDANGSAASLEGSWFTQGELYYSKGTIGTTFGGIPNGSIRYLHEGLIEAGNGIVIESSTKLNGAGAIKISSTGATIDDVTSSTTSTYSSNKIDSLVGDISTMLDSINGEVI